MIRFACPNCHKNLKAPDEGVGRKTHCPRCGQGLYVPPPIQTQEPSKPFVSPQPSGQASFECPTCQTTFFVPERMIGRMVDCPKCQTTFAALSDDYAQGNSRGRTTAFSEAPPSDERGTDEKYCHECGAVIRARAEICPKCGVRQQTRLGDDPSSEPHRGTAILVMGILGLVVFWPLGLIAWMWANQDLRKMDADIMDPEGRGSTQAGRICGMIATILFLVGVCLLVLYLFMFFFMCGVLLPHRHL